jgi:DnaJ-class molecular chaperone
MPGEISRQYKGVTNDKPIIPAHLDDSRTEVCATCGGTGKLFIYRNEVDRRYVGSCHGCSGTGRR